MNLKPTIVLLLLLLSSSLLASACSCQNNTYIQQISEVELVSILGNVSWGGNCTAYLLIPIRDKSVPSVAEVESNITQIGFGLCKCGVDYSSEKFKTYDCCLENPNTRDHYNCHKDCKNKCNSNWDGQKHKWLVNICNW
jgi:hypothetical protein